MSQKISDAVETLLHDGVAVTPRHWEDLQRQLGDRASSDGLLDVAVEKHDSPLGQLLVAATSDGIVRIGLANESEDEVLDDVALRVSPRVLFASRRSITNARSQLDEYFSARRREFTVELDWRLVKGFHRKVLDATREIPFGETESYTEVATEAGSPKAVRAAGTALARNPLPIIVPCHRVLRSDGGLGGYRGGLEVKKTLLKLEAQA